MQRRARYHTCRAERASCHSACTSPLPWAPAFFTPLLRKLRLERSSSQMANGLQRTAQAPPPAELDDVFVIAITALSTAAPDVLRCGISNRRMSAWGHSRPSQPILPVGALPLRPETGLEAGPANKEDAPSPRTRTS